MPRITGSVVDVAGRPASGQLRVRASSVRQNAGGTAVVDERTFEYPIVNGAITGTEVVDPGPATVSLSTSGRFRTWTVNVPAGTTVDLWTLVEDYVDYEPAVVAAAQQAAVDAQSAATQAAQAAQSIPTFPTGGQDGQALVKSGDGLAWGTATGGGGGGGIFLDTDGVPYYDTTASGGGSIALDTDGVPYLTGV